MVRIYLPSERDKQRLQEMSRNSRRSYNQVPQRRRRGFPGGTTISSGGADNKIVVALIDKEIKGSTQKINKQPNTDPAGASLAVWPIGIRVVSLKFFKEAQAAQLMFNGSGTAQDGGSSTITLAETAIAVDDYYTGGLITLSGDAAGGQTSTITDYDGTTKIATVDPTWGVEPSGTTVYTITKDDPGYTPPETGTSQGITPDTTNTIILESTASAEHDYYNSRTIRIISGPGEGDERFIVDYDGGTKTATVSEDWSEVPSSETEYEMPLVTLIVKTKETQVTAEPPAYKTEYEVDNFYYLDGGGFCLGEDYTRKEYDDWYPGELLEGDPWPPTNSPAGYWKPRYVAVAIPDEDGRLWLDFAVCKKLPPPSTTDIPE